MFKRLKLGKIKIKEVETPKSTLADLVSKFALTSEPQLQQYETKGVNPPPIAVNLSNFERDERKELVDYVAYAVPQAIGKEKIEDLRVEFIDSVKMGRILIEEEREDPSMSSKQQLFNKGCGLAGRFVPAKDDSSGLPTVYINQDMYQNAQQTNQYNANIFLAATTAHEIAHAYLGQPEPPQPIAQQMATLSQDQQYQAKYAFGESCVEYVACKAIETLSGEQNVAGISQGVVQDWMQSNGVPPSQADQYGAFQYNGYTTFNSIGVVVGQNEVFHGVADGDWSFFNKFEQKLEEVRAALPQAWDSMKTAGMQDPARFIYQAQDVFNISATSPANWANNAAENAQRAADLFTQAGLSSLQEIYFAAETTSRTSGNQAGTLLRDIGTTVDLQAQLMVDSAQLIQHSTPDARIYISPGAGIQKYSADNEGKFMLLPTGTIDFHSGRDNPIDTVGDLFTGDEIVGLTSTSLVAILRKHYSEKGRKDFVSPNEEKLRAKKLRIAPLDKFDHIKIYRDLDEYFDEHYPRASEYEKSLAIRAARILLMHSGYNPIKITPELLASEIHKIAISFQRLNWVSPTLRQVAATVAKFIEKRYSEKARDRFSRYVNTMYSEILDVSYHHGMCDDLIAYAARSTGFDKTPHFELFVVLLKKFLDDCGIQATFGRMLLLTEETIRCLKSEFRNNHGIIEGIKLDGTKDIIHYTGRFDQYFLNLAVSTLAKTFKESVAAQRELPIDFSYSDKAFKLDSSRFSSQNMLENAKQYLIEEAKHDTGK